MAGLEADLRQKQSRLSDQMARSVPLDHLSVVKDGADCVDDHVACQGRRRRPSLQKPRCGQNADD